MDTILKAQLFEQLQKCQAIYQKFEQKANYQPTYRIFGDYVIGMDKDFFIENVNVFHEVDRIRWSLSLVGQRKILTGKYYKTWLNDDLHKSKNLKNIICSFYLFDIYEDVKANKISEEQYKAIKNILD